MNIKDAVKSFKEQFKDYEIKISKNGYIEVFIDDEKDFGKFPDNYAGFPVDVYLNGECE